MFGKILSLLSLGSALTGISIAEKFVSIALTIVALTIVGSVITGALVMFGFYEFDEFLTRHGLDQDAAALFTVIVGIIVLAMIGFVITYKVKKLHVTPMSVSRVEGAATEVLAALRGFYRGVTEKRQR